jgi:hypothetical protein
MPIEADFRCDCHALEEAVRLMSNATYEAGRQEGRVQRKVIGYLNRFIMQLNVI